jgi:hypothetical protein
VCSCTGPVRYYPSSTAPAVLPQQYTVPPNPPDSFSVQLYAPPGFSGEGVTSQLCSSRAGSAALGLNMQQPGGGGGGQQYGNKQYMYVSGTWPPCAASAALGLNMRQPVCVCKGGGERGAVRGQAVHVCQRYKASPTLKVDFSRPHMLTCIEDNPPTTIGPVGIQDLGCSLLSCRVDTGHPSSHIAAQHTHLCSRVPAGGVPATP